MTSTYITEFWGHNLQLLTYHLTLFFVDKRGEKIESKNMAQLMDKFFRSCGVNKKVNPTLLHKKWSVRLEVMILLRKMQLLLIWSIILQLLTSITSFFCPTKQEERHNIIRSCFEESRHNSTAALSEPSTSTAWLSDPPTSSEGLSEPLTSFVELSEPATSTAGLSEPSISARSLSELSRSQSESPAQLYSGSSMNTNKFDIDQIAFIKQTFAHLIRGENMRLSVIKETLNSTPYGKIILQNYGPQKVLRRIKYERELLRN